MKARDFIQEQELHMDVTRRFDCPECGGHNSLSATKTIEGIKFFCHRASCGVGGVAASTLSVEDMSKVLHNTPENKNNYTFNPPEYWVAACRNNDTINYLTSYNLHDLYWDGAIDVKYDPRQDRHVFISRDSGDFIIGAFGRSNKRVIPKWYNYSDVDFPYIVKFNGDGLSVGGVVVEDPASAAAVSRFGDGISLLGTHLKAQYIPVLRGYEKLTICLDKDASKKSLDMQRKLCYYSDTRVVLLERDLKYLSPQEIETKLRMQK